MLTFTGKRLLATLPVLLVVAIAIFMIVRLIPGDPAAVIGGNSATSEDIDRIREQLGLTLPLWKQFAIWAQGVLHGDFGYSFFMNQPVTSLLMQRMEPTLSLTFGTLLFTVLIALPLGALAAWRMGGWLDRCVMSCSVVGFSIPVFVIGYLLIYALALKLQWLPVQGYNPLSKGFLPWLNNLILPCLTLSVTYVALLARVTRAAVSEALTEDFIRTARAKGITELQVLRHHALRVAAVPVATVIGVSAALLLGGVVVTETVFAIPGLGQLTVDAVLNRDFPVLQGVVLFFAVTYILLNFLIDLSYLLLDPRIRDE
ncbi:ABC transporter permease [Brenneria populi]|uniref:ABC transporter permease n=1 Tax=Brenneria populi TaxID=1505588 RepID=A0ABU6JTT9_9GAMM|nr:ABC transporter permease [Brenneria populi Li et al. 2015]